MIIPTIMKICLFAVQVFSLFLWSFLKINCDQPTDDNWQSLTFAIAVFNFPYDTDDFFNRLCVEKSNYYCLQGYLADEQNDLEYFDHIDNEDSQLPLQLAEQFESLIAPIYNLYNFYGIVRRGAECCGSQIFHFWHYGYKILGMTPSNYLHKLTDYSNESVPLNYVQYYYSPSCCANIITAVGFGPGRLRRKRIYTHSISPDSFQPFIFNLDLGPTSTSFSSENLQSELTFDWFKWNVMCQDRPWICSIAAEDAEQMLPPSPLVVYPSDSSNSQGRKLLSNHKKDNYNSPNYRPPRYFC